MNDGPGNLVGLDLYQDCNTLILDIMLYMFSFAFELK